MLASGLLHNTNQTDKPSRHLIASIRGFKPGPTLIVIGSIHGNEPAGVLAARRIRADLRRKGPLVRGEVVLLSGNTRGLARHVRYIHADLNRRWTLESIFAAKSAIKSATRSGSHFASAISEDLELRELLEHRVSRPLWDF